MRIVLGRGKKRIVYELPCGYLIAQVVKSDPVGYEQNLGVICNILNVPNNLGGR